MRIATHTHGAIHTHARTHLKVILSPGKFYKFETGFDFNLRFRPKCDTDNLCFAYRPSYFMPRTEGRKGFFFLSSPFSPPLFLIPAGSPTRDISRLLCSRAASFQFLSRLLPEYVSAAYRPNNRVARHVIYSLISTVAGIVCSEECVHCQP